MQPTLVAVEMGYGHLRPAHALAERLGVPLYEADRAPLADADEERLWARTRRYYELGSRLSQLPVGGPLRVALEARTYTPPLYPPRDLSAPTAGTRALEALYRRGLGRGLIGRLKADGSPLLTTFFATAVIADRAGCE